MATQEAFINQIAPIIQKYAKEYGYKVASPIIAQACLESGYGKSGLAKYHNYFGLKCGSAWKGASVNMQTKEEYQVGTLTTIRDNFRAYPSMEEGVKGYFDFISTKRYANLKTATTPQQYLEMIKADGYATSSLYVASNMAVVNKQGLTRYDDFANADTERKTGNPYNEPTKLVKLGSKGNDARWVQYQLNLFGYKLIVDGIIGGLTEGAIKDFQRSKGLEADGIVGPLTREALRSL